MLTIEHAKELLRQIPSNIPGKIEFTYRRRKYALFINNHHANVKGLFMYCMGNMFITINSGCTGEEKIETLERIIEQSDKDIKGLVLVLENKLILI